MPERDSARSRRRGTRTAVARKIYDRLLGPPRRHGKEEHQHQLGLERSRPRSGDLRLPGPSATMRLLAPVLYALYVLFAMAPQEHVHGFRQLAFDNAQSTAFGAYSFRLAEPDRPDKPTAWQGPLTISSAGKSCEADVSLVTAVYAAPAAPFVVVVTYSGSNTYVP